MFWLAIGVCFVLFVLLWCLRCVFGLLCLVGFGFWVWVMMRFLCVLSGVLHFGPIVSVSTGVFGYFMLRLFSLNFGRLLFGVLFIL